MILSYLQVNYKCLERVLLVIIKASHKTIQYNYFFSNMEAHHQV